MRDTGGERKKSVSAEEGINLPERCIHSEKVGEIGRKKSQRISSDRQLTVRIAYFRLDRERMKSLKKRLQMITFRALKTTFATSLCSLLLTV